MCGSARGACSRVVCLRVVGLRAVCCVQSWERAWFVGCGCRRGQGVAAADHAGDKVGVAVLVGVVGVDTAAHVYTAAVADAGNETGPLKQHQQHQQPTHVKQEAGG